MSISKRLREYRKFLIVAAVAMNLFVVLMVSSVINILIFAIDAINNLSKANPGFTSSAIITLLSVVVTIISASFWGAIDREVENWCRKYELDKIDCLIIDLNGVVRIREVGKPSKTIATKIPRFGLRLLAKSLQVRFIKE